MTVTVVVPARDAGPTIGRTLAALGAQTADASYEVIVVDSGSADDTAVIAAAAGVLVLDNPGGEPAGSRNLGARNGSGDVLAFTDADCAPEPGWLAAGLRALASADIAQGRVVAAGPAGPFDRTVGVASEHGLYETANLFVRRAWFDRVGGFEPMPGSDLGDGPPFGEDAWFAWRAKRAGALSAFADDAVVAHAVFPRGPREWILERARCRYFPPLVAVIPELRGSFLHRRWFLTGTSLRFDVAVAAAAAAAGRRHPGWLIGGAPYAIDLAADVRRRGQGPAFAVARVAADAVTFAALLRASIRARTPVL